MPFEPFLPLVPFALTVFAAQGVLMLVDEFYFHRRREIPRWERIGHPLDTTTVLAPILIATFLPATSFWMGLFVVLSVFSALFVTKDEWVHARLCIPGEQWLHAVLFLLHPVLFFAVFLLWRTGETGWIVLQAGVVTVFLAWQIFYWNGPWAPEKSP